MNLRQIDANFTYLNGESLSLQEWAFLLRNFPSWLLSDFVVSVKDDIVKLNVKNFYIKDSVNNLLVKASVNETFVLENDGYGILIYYWYSSASLPKLYVKKITKNDAYTYLLSNSKPKAGFILKHSYSHNPYSSGKVLDYLNRHTIKYFTEHSSHKIMELYKKIYAKGNAYISSPHGLIRKFSDYVFNNNPLESKVLVEDLNAHQIINKFAGLRLFPNARLGENGETVCMIKSSMGDFKSVMSLLQENSSFLLENNAGRSAILYLLGTTSNRHFANYIAETQKGALSVLKELQIIDAEDLLMYTPQHIIPTFIKYLDLEEQEPSLWEIIFSNKNYGQLYYLKKVIEEYRDKNNKSFFHHAIERKETRLFFLYKDLIHKHLFAVTKDGYSLLDLSILYDNWTVFNWLFRTMKHSGGIIITSNTNRLLDNRHFKYKEKLQEI